MKRKSVGTSLRREYLQGRVVALAERLQTADGAEALAVIDQMLETARQLLEVVERRNDK